MSLISRNIYVDQKRTSIRLEAAMWDALQDIAGRENVSTHHICSSVARACGQSSLTSSIRVFIMSYYRQLALKSEQLHIPDNLRPQRARPKAEQTIFDQALLRIA